MLTTSQVSDEIAKLKYKEPQSTKIVQLEQELVRAEAQSLVAEAQLSNIVRAPLDLYFRGLLTLPRLGKSSRKHTTRTSQPLLSARRSRSFWLNMLVGS